MIRRRFLDEFEPARIPQSFVVLSSWHMVCKLACEVVEFEKHVGQPDNGFRAWNAAVTAWHVRDWLATPARYQLLPEPVLNPHRNPQSAVGNVWRDLSCVRLGR